MILYFSATGNCKYTAQRIAEATGTRAVSILDYDCSVPVRADMAGLVFPTYFWGLPSIVSDFLRRVRWEDCSYLFAVATYGTTPGGSVKMAGALTRRNGKALDAGFSVIMPDTWTPMFDLSRKERVDQTLAAGSSQLAEVIAAVKARRTGQFVRRAVPVPIAGIAQICYRAARRTKTLSVDGSCTGCGLCAEQCPVKAIQLREDRPVWTAEQCVMCLGCLHRCPAFAIQRGKNTRSHGQYQNPNTTL